MFGYKILREDEYKKLKEGFPCVKIDKVKNYHDIATQLLKSQIEKEGLLEERKAMEYRLKSMFDSLEEQKEINLYYKKALNEMDVKQAIAVRFYDSLEQVIKNINGVSK